MAQTSRQVVTTVFIALVLDLLGTGSMRSGDTIADLRTFSFHHPPSTLSPPHSMVPACRSSFSLYLAREAAQSVSHLASSAPVPLNRLGAHWQTWRRDQMVTDRRERRGCEQKLGCSLAWRSDGELVQPVSMRHQSMARIAWVPASARTRTTSSSIFSVG